MAGFNEIIHQSLRLKIMATLNTFDHNTQVELTRLKSIVNATDGNLGAHLETLTKADYIATEKRFEGKRPQTRIKATAQARKAFTEHVAHLREILDIPTR